MVDDVIRNKGKSLDQSHKVILKGHFNFLDANGAIMEKS